MEGGLAIAYAATRERASTGDSPNVSRTCGELCCKPHHLGIVTRVSKKNIESDLRTVSTDS
jgi:hypothetical protein